MITQEMIKEGMKCGIVKLIDTDFGVACQIGDESFYFGGMDTDNISPEEYRESYEEEEIVFEIFWQLENMDKDREYYHDIYDKCRMHLKKNLAHPVLS